MKNVLLIFAVLLFFTSLANAQSNDEWKTVYSFSGSSNENTDDFIIKSNKWRIIWEANKQYQEIYGGNVVIKLVDSKGDEDMIANTIPNDSGKTIMRKKGKFYFDVFCVLAKWKIGVQEFLEK